MNKIAVLLLATLPALAHGADLLPEPGSAKACYDSLPPGASNEALAGAIACLSGNPYAGSATVDAFADAQRAALASYRQDAAGAALEQLRARKAQRMYVQFQSRWQERALMVVERAVVALPRRGAEEPQALVRDLSAVTLRLMEKSALFGGDTLVPLAQVSAFEYQESPRTRGIGTFTTVHADGARVVDTSYQGHYPVRVCDAACKHWSAVLALSGPVYRGRRMDPDSTLKLDQDSLHTVAVTFLSEADGKREVARYEAALEETAREQARIRQADAAEAARRAQQLADNAARLGQARIGTEDVCRRTDLGKYVVLKDPTVDLEVSCQFGGKVMLHALQRAGWLVVNKQWREDVVTEYLVRKAR